MVSWARFVVLRARDRGIMSKLRAFLLGLFLAGIAAAQVPNCQINFGPWTTNNTSNIVDNRTLQCAYFVMTYQVTGTPTISVTFQSATGATTPGAFVTYSGVVTSGLNPSTSTACATVTNCTAVFTGPVGWFRVTATVSGTGTVIGTLQGYKAFVPLGGNTLPSGSGCPGTAGTPCVVDGVTAAGSPPTTPPVLVAGQDGTNVRSILTDVSGSVVPSHTVGATADGIVATRTQSDDVTNPLYSRTIRWEWNGTNYDRDFVCSHQAAITLSAGTDVVIIAGVAAKTTRICHIDFAATAVGTFTIQEGTGVTCGTGTAAITGAYPSIVTFAQDYQPTAALRTATQGDDICLHAGGAATVGGFVSYAQF